MRTPQTAPLTGRLQVLCDEALVDAVTNAARKDDRSINSFIRTALREALQRKERAA
jgi:hypothetical protein